jgi:hypothetical protein
MSDLNCQCICPSAENPTPLQIGWNAPSTVLDIQLFGTLGFTASILTNVNYPNTIPPLPVISSVSTFGSILRVIFNAPPNPEAGVYDVVVQVCNACGSWDIPIRLEVVDPVIIPTTDCGLSQATFPPSATPMQVGDQILAFRAGACITVDPVLPPDVCATLGAFPELPLAPVTDRVVVIDAVNNCKLVPADDFLQGLTLCVQIENLLTDDIMAGDQVVAFRPGAPNVCVRGDAFDMVCASLQALAPLAGSPATLVVGTDGGVCGTLDIPTLVALLNIPPFDGGTIANPIEGPDGSCAAPTYSFTTDPSSGLFYEAGVPAVTLGYSNCSSFVRIGDVVRIEAANGDFIEVGASINLATASELQINGSPGVAGQILTSAGPGLPPTWQAPATVTCPLALTCDGSYAIPSYSWLSRPDAGFLMLDPTALAPKIGIALEGIRFARLAVDDYNFNQYRRTFQLFGEQTLSTNVYPRFHVTQFYNGHSDTPASVWTHLHATAQHGIGLGASDAALDNRTNFFAFNNDVACGANGSRIDLSCHPTDALILAGNSPVGNPNRVMLRLEDRSVALTLFEIARDETLNELNIRLNEGVDGAGVGAGTLTNAPAAGDPTFWLRVTINGVQRFIPAW